MKRRIKENQKITKGMPSAVVLSILIHATLFLLAGMLVVFTVVKKEEQKFEPPKAVERPKMKLKKPKVKVKKTSKPKPTTRIVTKMNRASMPDIQLPEMSGMGEGLGDMVGGFDIMPDLDEPTLFGASQSIGNDFMGTFYDIKRDRRGKPLWSTDLWGYGWRDTLNKFFSRGWDFSVFNRYYRSPKKLYATSFVVPVTISSLAPVAFDDEDACGGLWAVHYKGRLVCPASHTNGITFRFWASADEFMAVKVDGKVVLAFDWPKSTEGMVVPSSIWNTDSTDSRKYWLGSIKSVVGNWISLEPGESVEMEMITGGNGGVDHHFLLVEEQGVEYEYDPLYGPLLPAFKTAEFTRDKLDLIYRDLPVEDRVCLTNGPVFCDYDTSGTGVIPRAEQFDSVAPPKLEVGMRTWALADGRTLEAEFVSIFSGKVVLKNGKGKIRRIEKAELSMEDVEYAELARSPSIDINFLNSLETVSFTGGFYDFERWVRHPEKQGYFGVQLKQTSAGEYSHELQVEMFVVGQQREGNKYLFLDRQQFTFNPAETRFVEFHSERKVELQDYPDYYQHMIHGDKYIGYLVTVTDKRGRIIEAESPKKWLLENLGNLKNLKVGNYFDKSCMRTFPDRPPPLPLDRISY